VDRLVNQYSPIHETRGMRYPCCAQHCLCLFLFVINSNADERYGDSILPMLGVTFDVLHFACFSKDYGLEKPDARIFMSAIKEAEGWIFNTEDPLLPGHCLHIGNGTYDT
jgi:FMN phosphatase YigB (HAD superfamily)